MEVGKRNLYLKMFFSVIQQGRIAFIYPLDIVNPGLFVQLIPETHEERSSHETGQKCHVSIQILIEQHPLKSKNDWHQSYFFSGVSFGFLQIMAPTNLHNK